MDTTELLKKVRKIEIRTRGLSNQLFSGEYHSAFKGRGMTFSEVRDYQYGDDMRTIDWNVTARFNAPYVKVFEEERELTVMLLVDVSGSREFGTVRQLKQDLITELSAVLAFSALQNNDKVGALLFSDIVEKFIPPKKGASHILRIIRELIDFSPVRRETGISAALRYFTGAIRKRSIAFLISDFLDEDFGWHSGKGEETLKIANKKHDVVAIRICDRREEELPPVGLLKIRDAESGRFAWVDAGSSSLRLAFRTQNERREKRLSEILTRCGVDSVKIATDQPYVRPLMNLFKRKERRK